MQRHRHGHGEQQIIILGQVQPGIGIEHAAKRAQEDCQQPQSAQNTASPSPHAAIGCAEGQRQKGKYPAQNAHHNHHEQRRCTATVASLGAGLVFLGIIEVAAENLRSAASGAVVFSMLPPPVRGTPASSESSPLTSSMVPERISWPSLMMATLSQSFSATSSTWVEKKIAPPCVADLRASCP